MIPCSLLKQADSNSADDCGPDSFLPTESGGGTKTNSAFQPEMLYQYPKFSIIPYQNYL
jgi:hypothetical protein